MTGIPLAASNTLIALVVIVPIALIVLPMTWIMLKLSIGSSARRQRGEAVLKEDAEQHDVAAEFEQMRREQAGE
jgi:hypothetical protein